MVLGQTDSYFVASNYGAKLDAFLCFWSSSNFLSSIEFFSRGNMFHIISNSDSLFSHFHFIFIFLSLIVVIACRLWKQTRLIGIPFLSPIPSLKHIKIIYR